MITQAQLKEKLHYNPDTGVFTRKISTCNKVKVGDIAGYIHTKGYILISLNSKKYCAHRLAFLYMGGEIPEEVDHINHIRKDNRWFNLRAVTHNENCRNISMQKVNKSGFNGICWHKKAGKWQAYISVQGRCIHLGYFTDKNNAISARKEANIKHGFHGNHGLGKTV